MGCKLTQNIKHNCEYNPGGISEVYLLDIKDFEGYFFKDDGLYDSCHVERIMRKGEFIQLDVVNESGFTEKQEGGIFKQELQTFVRSMQSRKTAQLLLATSNRYLVLYKLYDDRWFTFGQDGGASVSFTQQSGQVGEASGYQLTISKSSIYPQFELDEVARNANLFCYEDEQPMFAENGFYVELEKN